jgi:hypothetical protein
LEKNERRHTLGGFVEVRVKHLQCNRNVFPVVHAVGSGYSSDGSIEFGDGTECLECRVEVAGVADWIERQDQLLEQQKCE